MARPQLHDLTISDIRVESPNAKSLAFEVPDELKDDMAFIQGQYLTLVAEVNGEMLRRQYSVCVPPSSGEWRVCIKKDFRGRFSTYANDELKVGDTLGVMSRAMGRFYAPVEPEKRKSYVMLAGGSGVTPIISNIITILEQEPKSDVTLFYGNRSRHDIIFRETFNDLKNTYIDRLRVFHVLSDEQQEIELFEGMMTEDKVTNLVLALTDKDATDFFFICGPGPMMDGAMAALEGLGVEKERIKMESFGNRILTTPAAPEEPVAETTETAELVVDVDGRRVNLDIPLDAENILDFVTAAGVDIPFSCKSGICSTCRAKVIEGAVDMGKVEGLAPEEIENGYILTCSARPKPGRIVLQYEM